MAYATYFSHLHNTKINAIDIFKKNDNKEQYTNTAEDLAKIEKLLIKANVFKSKKNLIKAIEKAKEAQTIAESSTYL